MGYSSAEELHRAITKLTATIQHIKDKMQGQQTGQGNLSQVSQDGQTNRQTDIHGLFLSRGTPQGNHKIDCHDTTYQRQDAGTTDRTRKSFSGRSRQTRRQVARHGLFLSRGAITKLTALIQLTYQRQDTWTADNTREL